MTKRSTKTLLPLSCPASHCPFLLLLHTLPNTLCSTLESLDFSTAQHEPGSSLGVFLTRANGKIKPSESYWLSLSLSLSFLSGE